MAFERGHKKQGGRKKGSPNKRTREFLSILEEKNFCPVRALIENYEIAMKEYRRSGEVWDAILDKKRQLNINTPTEDTGPTYLKLAQSAASDLMQYAHPKRKAIEVALDANETSPLHVKLAWADEDENESSPDASDAPADAASKSDL